MKKHLQEMKRPSWAGFARHALAAAVAAAVAAATPVFAKDKPEKPDVKFGFIKLTDMAPLAVAYEKGYFEEEGLFVTLEAQANWKVLLDRVISGELDGAHMLAGQPIAAKVLERLQGELIDEPDDVVAGPADGEVRRDLEALAPRRAVGCGGW